MSGPRPVTICQIQLLAAVAAPVAGASLVSMWLLPSYASLPDSRPSLSPWSCAKTVPFPASTFTSITPFGVVTMTL